MSIQEERIREQIKELAKQEANQIDAQIQLLKVRGKDREAAILDLNQRLIKMQKDYGYTSAEIEEIKASEIKKIDKEIKQTKKKADKLDKEIINRE